MKNYSPISFDVKNNKFSAIPVNGSYETKGPLSVGFQITRKCNLKCVYCSEPFSGQEELDLPEIEKIMGNLASGDTRVVKLTGGEPLLRQDIFDIAGIIKSFGMHVAIDTNATLIDGPTAKLMSEKLMYVETTLDGTEEMHNKIRGNYRQVLKGIDNLSKYDIDIFLATIVLENPVENIRAVIDFSRNYNIKTLKIMSPIPKGRGKDVLAEYAGNQSVADYWESVCEYKKRVNPGLKLILLDWTKIGPGSVILIQPDGRVVGSPSIGEAGCITPLGNLRHESILTMWDAYKYKSNHICKCLEQTVYWR